jgi:hypothetical protein
MINQLVHSLTFCSLISIWIQYIKFWSYFCCEFESRSQHYMNHDEVCQWLATNQWFSPGTPVSSTNKTERHDIMEILLKVALNTINITIFSKLRVIHIQYKIKQHISTKAWTTQIPTKIEDKIKNLWMVSFSYTIFDFHHHLQI